MSTFDERYENTKILVFSEQVTPTEAFAHLYYFMRFEIAFAKATRQQRKMRRFHKKLDENLEVFKMRLQMADL